MHKINLYLLNSQNYTTPPGGQRFVLIFTVVVVGFFILL